MRLSGFDHFVLTVRDMAATEAFYCGGLGMRLERFRAGDGSERAALVFGAHKINLHPADRPFAPHAAAPAPGSGDFCLLTEMPLTDWAAHLAARGIPVVEGPVARTGARGPIRSIYLRDPDGNLVEIARYPDRGMDP